MTDTQNITLAGTSYAIPPLAIKQNRHIEVLAARNRDYFVAVRDARATGAVIPTLTEQQAEDFTRIVYHALTRSQPSLTFQQFEDLPITMKEIMVALSVCVEQTGMFKPAAESAPQSGEPIQASIGTGS